MIHVIPHHIGKGSWVHWYDLIHFKDSEEVSYYKVDNPLKYEFVEIPKEQYYPELINHLSIINPKEGDYVFCDLQYFPYENHEIFYESIEEVAKKYKIKFFVIDTDNFHPYVNTEYYTIFSNRFNRSDSSLNFNYFRYRPAKEHYIKNIIPLFDPFLENIRQKKLNFIVGVDKVERLLALKHIYDTNLNLDSYVGYSGFNHAYSDDDISESLLKFRDSHLPIILDTPFERSEMGAVNVDYPPFPITLNSYVSAVCETSVILDHLHLSEKSWNPLMSLNIPLILGSTGLVDYLQEIGFWVANDIFDTSIKFNYVEIVNQFKSNLDVVNNMSYNDLYDYFRSKKRAMVDNNQLLIKQKFIFDRNNYK